MNESIVNMLNVVYNTNDPSSKASILLHEVERALSESNILYVDEILDRVEFSKLGAVGTIGVIKSTARVKAVLPHHQLATKLATNYLCSLGYDGRKIFGSIYETTM